MIKMLFLQNYSYYYLRLYIKNCLYVYISQKEKAVYILGNFQIKKEKGKSLSHNLLFEINHKYSS